MAADPAMRFTVSELTARIKQMLERGFPALLVEGEISNARPSAAGHLYFTLKDEDASISAVMFRGRASGLSDDARRCGQEQRNQKGDAKGFHEQVEECYRTGSRMSG